MKGTQESTRALRELFERAGDLKSTRRAGWIERLGIADCESVADHAYATAFMSMVYADIAGLDACKASRMALLHDLAESITGDITPESPDAEKKREKEEAAMQSILSLLPDSVRGQYSDAWAEYVSGESGEAALVRQVDKLEMAMQARRYAHIGDIGPFTETARRRVRDPALLRMLDSIECAPAAQDGASPGGARG